MNYCAIEVQTWARPPSNLEERAKMVAHIPHVAFRFTWAALERATAVVNEEAVQYGWHFHLPMRGAFRNVEGYMYREEVYPETIAAIDDLLNLAQEGSDEWHNYLHDIGAKGRRRVFLDQAHRPRAFALGIRNR